jgi:hypothetical protein
VAICRCASASDIVRRHTSRLKNVSTAFFTSVDELLEQCPRLPYVEDVSVSSGRPPEVDRPEGSPAVILTFRGTREQKVRDRDTRIRIALQGPQAVRLWRLLGERLTDDEKTGD